MKKIEFLGQTCFIGSNTYHVAAAFVDGENVAQVDFCYGYGDQWLYNLTEEFSNVAAGLGLPSIHLQGEKYPMQPWQYIRLLETSGCAVFTNCTEVKKRSQLTLGNSKR